MVSRFHSPCICDQDNTVLIPSECIGGVGASSTEICAVIRAREGSASQKQDKGRGRKKGI